MRQTRCSVVSLKQEHDDPTSSSLTSDCLMAMEPTSSAICGRGRRCRLLSCRRAVPSPPRSLRWILVPDDYLVKPFGTGELLARVRAQVRRSMKSVENTPIVTFGDVRIDLDRRIVERAGVPVHLTPLEYRLLTHLCAHPDRVLTHLQLLKAVWGPSHQADTQYLRVFMGGLRKKIEADPSQPCHLVTETGVGYRFIP